VKEAHQEPQVNLAPSDLREAPVSKEDVVSQVPRVKVGHLARPELKVQSVTKDDKERQVQPAQKVQ